MGNVSGDLQSVTPETRDHARRPLGFWFEAWEVSLAVTLQLALGGVRRRLYPAPRA